MARRRSRKATTSEALSGLVVLIAAGLYSVGDRLAQLPLAWQVVLGVASSSILFALGWSLVAAQRRARTMRLIQANLQDLSPTGFEECIAQLLIDLGWTQVQRRGGSGDRGVDVIATYGDDLYLVQCKRYTKSVAPAQVRDLVGALHIQQADRALLVTTGNFTAQGYEEARDQPVELWDGTILSTKIREVDQRRSDPQLRQRNRQRVMRVATALLFCNAALILWALFTAGSPFVAQLPL
jgi:restriction system protein